MRPLAQLGGANLGETGRARGAFPSRVGDSIFGRGFCAGVRSLRASDRRGLQSPPIKGITGVRNCRAHSSPLGDSHRQLLPGIGDTSSTSCILCQGGLGHRARGGSRFALAAKTMLSRACLLHVVTGFTAYRGDTSPTSYVLLRADGKRDCSVRRLQGMAMEREKLTLTSYYFFPIQAPVTGTT